MHLGIQSIYFCPPLRRSSFYYFQLNSIPVKSTFILRVQRGWNQITVKISSGFLPLSERSGFATPIKNFARLIKTECNTSKSYIGFGNRMTKILNNLFEIRPHCNGWNFQVKSSSFKQKWMPTCPANFSAFVKNAWFKGTNVLLLSIIFHWQ